MIATTIFRWYHFQQIFFKRIERLKVAEINFSVIVIVNNVKFKWKFVFLI